VADTRDGNGRRPSDGARGGIGRAGAARDGQDARGHRSGAQRTGDQRSGQQRSGQQRSGEQRSGEQRSGEQRSGEQRSGEQRRAPRPPEPDLPEDIDVKLLDGGVRSDLLSLDKSNAEAVARHLVMAGLLVDEDPQRALAHARAARARAGRVAVVREATGIAAYHAGEWAEAIAELRAARRMAGGPGLVAVLADCERALGRPERALELARSPEGRSLTGEAAEELRIVAAGARRDLGQLDAAVVMLQTRDLDPARTGTAAARYFYAYADALLAAGRAEDALRWFLAAASADEDGETDAEERVMELGGAAMDRDVEITVTDEGTQ